MEYFDAEFEACRWNKIDKQNCEILFIGNWLIRPALNWARETHLNNFQFIKNDYFLYGWLTILFIFLFGKKSVGNSPSYCQHLRLTSRSVTSCLAHRFSKLSNAMFIEQKTNENSPFLSIFLLFLHLAVWLPVKGDMKFNTFKQCNTFSH